MIGRRRFRRIAGALLAALFCALLMLTVSGCGEKPAPQGEPSGTLELVEEQPGTSETETEQPEATEAEPPEASGTEQTETASEPAVVQETDTQTEGAPQENNGEQETPEIDEDGVYTTKEDVALYLHIYGKLPSNFITKKEARNLGWNGGSLEEYAPGKCIGGDHYGNYEGTLPDGNYRECDIDTLGKKKRGSRRIIYSDDGRIYYSGDHYKTFELLYGEEE